MQKKDYLRIFDTTLRDGEQAPGYSMNVEEKVKMGLQLARLGVDVIEAGFPSSSPGDFEGVLRIAQEVKGPVICALARTTPEDIDRAYSALIPAERKRIHTFIATSEIHMKHKLKMTPDEVLEAAGRAVERARKYTEDVEFSCEDATRSDPEFLLKVYQRAIDAGAVTINVPDTVGYTVPLEFSQLIRFLKENLKGLEGVVISAHCHDDLGLAVANSIAAIEAGARQVECTINGIGERAGNASMEEIVMALKVRKDIFGIETGIDTRQIYPTSRLLCQITGHVIQPNKAIVGVNAFAHEAGIHQDGVLKYALTYEIMKPEDVGLTMNRLVLGKHSGRHAFRHRLEELGYYLEEEALNRAFQRFKQLADVKKEVFDEDLEALVAEEVIRIPYRYQLRSVNVASGTEMQPTATVVLDIDGKREVASATGNGPVDAALNAVKKITGTKAILEQYLVSAITGGTDAQGEVTVRLEEDGRVVLGQGSDTDIVVASAKAYVHALNKLAYRREMARKVEVEPTVGP
jgi:2-isopropylmalate synthase